MTSRAGLTADRVARLVGGELIGPGDVPLAGVAALARAGPGELAFLAARRYVPQFQASQAGAVLVAPGFRDVHPGPATRIVVTDPLRAAALVLRMLHPEPEPAWGVHPTAALGRGARWEGRVAIGAGARLGANVRLGAGCVIAAGAVLEADIVLGAWCRIGPHAVLHRGVRLGRRVVVHAGARVGGPGFGFVQGPAGAERIPPAGGCVLDDDVELGANTTVDRGSVEDTVIGPGTKIDNLVQIGHHTRIGARCIIMGQVGIGGSTVIEDEAILGGQAGLAGHLTVGRGARVAAQAGVIGDVPPGETVSGYPARSHRAVLRQAAALGRLAPLVPTLERIARQRAAAVPNARWRSQSTQR